MGDIDFDELDKAVTSVMGPADETKTSLDDAVQPVDTSVSAPTQLAEPPVAAPEPVVAAPAPVVVPEPVAVQDLVAPPVSNPSVPRPAGGGMFMDVKHPSSNMATVTGTTPASSAPDIGVSGNNSAPVQDVVASPFLPNAQVAKRPLGGEPPTGDFNLNNDQKPQPNNSADPQRAVDAGYVAGEDPSTMRELQALEASPSGSIQSVESGDTGATVQTLTGTSFGSANKPEEPKGISAATIVISGIVVVVIAAIVAVGLYIAFA